MYRLISTSLFASIAVSAAFAQAWNGYGGNGQHTGTYTGTSQTAAVVNWQAPLDEDRSYYGGEVLIHYASPMITANNTVVHSYRYDGSGSGASQYDHWRVIGRAGGTGAQVYSVDTDYSAARIFPNDWTSVYPVTLFKTSMSTATGLAFAGAGGSVYIRSSADSASSKVIRYVFYTSQSDYNLNAANYAPVKVNTPLTADAAGNIYFGYEVDASVPPSLNPLGAGGIVKLNPTTGAATYRSISAMNLGGPSVPAVNAAPAVTADGNYVYAAVNGPAELVKLDTATLSPQASVVLMDPSVPGGGAGLIAQSSASPMIGPDGHVFMGVFGNQWRESHGWMLQFDANLSQTDSLGNQFPVGSFGWDDTASVAPATMVPSYHGSSSYLIVTKYNNYDDNGGDPGADGSNKVGVLDPKSNSLSTDRQTGIPVMNEVLTVLSPTLTNNDGSHPDARNEWCINSVAVDVARKSAIINCEDGHMYRWSFVTNSLVEALDLQPATGEAYTGTEIGPDGQIYATNNSILFAIGATRATAVSTYQGSYLSGNLQNIWYLDGSQYLVQSVVAAAGQQAAAEADFTLPSTTGTTFSVSANASGISIATAFIYAFNYSSQQFDQIGSGQFGYGVTRFTATVTSNASRYVGPNGAARVLVRGLSPKRITIQRFVLGVDFVTCSLR